MTRSAIASWLAAIGSLGTGILAAAVILHASAAGAAVVVSAVAGILSVGVAILQWRLPGSEAQRTLLENVMLQYTTTADALGIDKHLASAAYYELRRSPFTRKPSFARISHLSFNGYPMPSKITTGKAVDSETQASTGSVVLYAAKIRSRVQVQDRDRQGSRALDLIASPVMDGRGTVRGVLVLTSSRDDQASGRLSDLAKESAEKIAVGFGIRR